MSRIRRESLGEDGLDVREPFERDSEVLAACRSGDAMAGVPAGKRILRVLVVDDDHDCADSLSQLVNLWGDDARTAYDGAAALEMAVVHQPHVVLLDLAMPKMDGCQAARQLRQQTAFVDTLLIAVSGWTDEVHLQRCDEAGFDHYLLKPIDLARLEILLFRERRWLTRPAEEVEKTKETGGAVMAAVKKAVFWRVGNVVYS